jgi:hypothetical protein
MTDEEKTRAREQAKRFLAAPLPEPTPETKPERKKRKVGWTKSRALPIGVYLAQARCIKPYRVQMRKGGKAFTFGRFDTVEEADQAVKKWLEENG